MLGSRPADRYGAGMMRRVHRPGREGPSPGSASRSSWRLVAWLGALALTACSDSSPDVVVERHDTWFDQLDRVAVLEYPTGNLPGDVAGWLERESTPAVETLDPGNWSRQRDVPIEYQEGFALAPGTAVWGLTDGPVIRTVPGPPRIVHAGKAMTALFGASPVDPNQAVPLWWDRQAGLVVWWDSEQQQLRALTDQQPGVLKIEPGRSEDGKELRYERPARSGPELPSVDQLELLVELDDITRRSLLLPAPGRLSLAMAGSTGSRLSLTVGLIDHALHLEQGELRTTAGLSDGARCSVEVEVDGRRERVWSELVQPGEPWHAARVDLSAWQGRDVTLHLVSEPGPDANAAFDYVAWSGLQLSGGPAPVDARPTVVLVMVDTLRADRLGCYGYPIETSPRLDAWAGQQAVVYEDAVADASWTLPSLVSIFTGRSVLNHRVGDARVAVGKDMTLLAERLSDAGYATFGICGGGNVRPQFGFARGFDTFIVQPDHEPDWDPAMAFLAELDGARPGFVFLQTYIVHHPFAADDGRLPLEQPYDGWLADEDITYWNVIGPYLAGELELSDADQDYVRHLYDAGVRRLDDVLADVLEELERRFADRELLVVVTSDHGDEHFEHGGMDHGHSLYAELLNVPLIVRSPDRLAGRVSAPVSTLDILPTILDVVGLQPPDDLPGRVLGGPLPDQLVRVGGNKNGMLSVQYDGRKLLQTEGADGPELALYDLRNDPTEQHDLVDEQPLIVQALLARLAAFMDEHLREVDSGAAQESLDLDEAALEQLRELGYMGDH
jgi:arylsulfatase A-like enzyme